MMSNWVQIRPQGWVQIRYFAWVQIRYISRKVNVNVETAFYAYANAAPQRRAHAEREKGIRTKKKYIAATANIPDNPTLSNPTLGNPTPGNPRSRQPRSRQ